MPKGLRIPRWANVTLAIALSAIVVLRIASLMDREDEVFKDPTDRARIRLHFLAQRIDSLRATPGIPETLALIVAGLPNDQRDYLVLDAWDRPIRFTRGAATYELRSAGPDSMFNTADDIVAEGRVK